MRVRRLRRYSETNEEFLTLKERLMRRPARCPLCARWDDPYEEVTKVCVICEDTGRIPAWHALPLWLEQVIKEPPLEAQDEDRVYALQDRLEHMIVKCPFCRGAGVGVRDYPCPVCYRAGTTNAWESATLLMARCPHCQGSGVSPGVPGAASSCVVCCTTGEVPVHDALRYNPELWWETFGSYLSFEACLSESDLDDCLGAFDLRAEARPGRSWMGVDLTFEDLSGLDLRNSDFADTRFGNLSGSNLARSTLDAVRIESAPQANFSRASLRGARLSRAGVARDQLPPRGSARRQSPLGRSDRR